MGKLRARKKNWLNPGGHCLASSRSPPNQEPQETEGQPALLPAEQRMWEGHPLTPDVGVGVTTEVGVVRQLP